MSDIKLKQVKKDAKSEITFSQVLDFFATQRKKGMTAEQLVQIIPFTEPGFYELREKIAEGEYGDAMQFALPIGHMRAQVDAVQEQIRIRQKYEAERKGAGTQPEEDRFNQDF